MVDLLLLVCSVVTWPCPTSDWGLLLWTWAEMQTGVCGSPQEEAPAYSQASVHEDKGRGNLCSCGISLCEKSNNEMGHPWEECVIRSPWDRNQMKKHQRWRQGLESFTEPKSLSTVTFHRGPAGLAWRGRKWLGIPVRSRHACRSLGLFILPWRETLSGYFFFFFLTVTIYWVSLALSQTSGCGWGPGK